MKTIFFIAVTCLFCCSCSKLPQRDFFTLLPENSAAVCTIISSDNELSLTSCRKGQQFIVHIVDCSGQQENERRIEAVLVRRAYGSLWSRVKEESLEDCVSERTEKSLTLSIPADRLRHAGGPWDYSLRMVLHSPEENGKVLSELRLYSRCPAPGALRSNPDFFDRTYSRNTKQLKLLQEAASRCHSMRFMSMDFHSDERIDRRFNTEEHAELCRLISRMRPVRTQLATMNPAGVSVLQILDGQGKPLHELSLSSVAAAHEVSPENVAIMCRFSLSDEDAASWYKLFRF